MAKQSEQRVLKAYTMLYIPFFLLLSNGLIVSIGASSPNNGPNNMGTSPNIMAANNDDEFTDMRRLNSIRNENHGSFPKNIESTAVNSSPERENASDLPITDAASALAAKYAVANIVTGNIIDSKSTGNNASTGSGGGGGGWFGKILGKGSSPDNGKGVETKAGSDGIPPPPPPPPLQQQHGFQHEQSSGLMKQPQSRTQTQQKQQSPHNYNTFSNNYQPYLPQSYIDPASYQNLLYELDESTLREMTLTHQLHNISAHVDTLTSESENLIMRIDVLTERLADTTANFNFVHNRNLELEKNCTALSTAVDTLNQEIVEYETKVTGIEGEKIENEKILAEIRSELRRVTDELEQLACLVETERFETEKIDFLKDFKRKQGLKRRKKKGFWAWLFGFDSEDKIDDSSDGEQERLRAAQELARSTLLHALQTERSSVEELEASLITLQRNNSAIMDVVQSKNSLINELNDRVAVFEEDKMVLKAALRQLQKEIREEAPKLVKAQESEQRLMEQLEQLQAEYNEDTEIWQQQLEEGEIKWNRTKDELMLIGTYVDQLEDRLATFAIAKKEIELREAQCQDLEAEAARHAKEAESWKSQVESLAKEQGETKPLLEDLVKERAQTRVKMDELRNQCKDLQDQIQSWKQKVADAEQQGEEIKSQSARQLFLKIEESKREWEVETSRRIEEQKQRWNIIKAREFQESLEREREAWQAQSALDFEQRFALEKADLQDSFRDQQSHLETSIAQEWNNKLIQQKNELEAHFQNELMHRLESERRRMREQKEMEIQQRLADERASWDASILAKSTAQSMSLEDEVERAASKVFDMLEREDISFGANDSLIEPQTDSVQQTLVQVDKQNESSTFDVRPEETSESSILNVSLQNATSALNTLNRQQRPSRDVPFRAVRKAFSRATGMHGVITPSTVQMRQRAMLSQQRRNKQMKKQPQENDSHTSEQELSSAQALAGAEELQSQTWNNESENSDDISTDMPDGDEWNYDSESVATMPLVEPPQLPDFDEH